MAGKAGKYAGEVSESRQQVIDQESSPGKPLFLLKCSVVLLGLYLTSRYSYLLFHSLVEIFSVIVACGIFIIAWNSRHIMSNNYFLLFGIASLFVGGFDLLHTLSYKGMNVFPGYGPNLATQLWIAERYLQSLSLLAAPIFLGRKLRRGLAMTLFFVTTALLLAAVFGGVFPDCFVEGSGLTPFKIGSEYVVSCILLGSLYFMRRKGEFFEQQVMHLISVAIVLFIASGLAFTLYTDTYGISNMIGHFLELGGYFLIYKALIETSLVRPYNLIFREIKAQNEELRVTGSELARLLEKSRHAEEELLRAKEEWEHTFDSVPDLIAIIDVHHRVMRVNRAMAGRLGREPAECLGLPCYNMVHGLNMPPHSCPHSRTIEDCREHNFELNEERLGGDFLVSTTPLMDRDGQMIGSVHVARDITERKRAEEALKKLNEELENRVGERTKALAASVENLTFEIIEREHAEESVLRLNQLYAVLSETNQAIVRTRDRESLFTDFCRIAVEHGGFLLAWVGLVDEAIGEVRPVAMHGRTAYLDDIRITVTDEPTGEGPTGVTIRDGTYHICNDFQNDPSTRLWHERGKAHGIRASASVALKEDGQVKGALSFYSGKKDYFDEQHVNLLRQMGMDISYALENFNRETSRLETERALREETEVRLQTIEALREKEQMLLQQSRQAAMGEMIGNIAHQWRQPLNALGLFTQRLGLLYGSPAFNKELLDNSVADSMEIIKHMSKTIDDFSDYFKPDKKKVDFSVRESVNITLSLLEGSFQHPRISVDIVENAVPVIHGYQNEFAQALLNILVNARDAVIERNIADARVTITVCSENECAVVTVADNAGGIPDEAINKVFDPYFTTKGPQHGTGVGLFMSKNIIEKNMGGRLTVQNTATGAEFRIEVSNGTCN